MCSGCGCARGSVCGGSQQDAGPSAAGTQMLFLTGLSVPRRETRFLPIRREAVSLAGKTFSGASGPFTLRTESALPMGALSCRCDKHVEVREQGGLGL